MEYLDTMSVKDCDNFNKLKESYTNNYWNIGPTHGFMPIKDPLPLLPERYQQLQDIINKMPIVNEYKSDGGYLAIANGIEAPVLSLLSVMDDVVKETDVFIIASLYRALTFITSAYLLEPAHQHQQHYNTYGKARTFLPKNIAQPLVYVAEKLGVHPYLDYHYAYSLGNYIRIDINKGYEYDNLRMACSFSGKSDESGFIMLHVDIVSKTPKMLSSIWSFARHPNVQALKDNYHAMIEINERRKLMWVASNWRKYNDFRVFIMGIEGNISIYGNDGVVYEGCFNDKPQLYRGQTGAQDDVIPTADIFTGVINYYPENELTQYLLQMREYRPPPVRTFFHDLQSCNFTLQTFEALGVEALVYLLAIVDQIYIFRNGHWMFVQKYILSTTKYPVATGGTPILTWLPNQIGAVLSYQEDIIARVDRIGGYDSPLYVELKASLPVKLDLLRNQKEELMKEEYDIDAVYSMNSTVEYSPSSCPYKHNL